MTTEMEKEVNPHFEDFLFDWRCKTQLLIGGYGSSKSYHVALKILLKLLARTEGGRVRSQADLAVEEQASKTAGLTKIWMSSLDTRVRKSHRKLDGQKADKDGYFHYGS